MHLKPALLVGALVLLWLSMLLLGTGPVDRRILLELYAGHRPALAEAARLMTMFGDGRVVTIFAGAGAIILFARKKRWAAAMLFIGTALGKALTELQKFEFNRLRPTENPHLVVVHDLSFPSGHSANSMMTYVALALLLSDRPEQRRLWTAGAISFAILVGLSRVMLGVHWPSDVVGGWSYGLFWALLICAISRRREKKGRVA